MNQLRGLMKHSSDRQRFDVIERRESGLSGKSQATKSGQPRVSLLTRLQTFKRIFENFPSIKS